MRGELRFFDRPAKIKVRVTVRGMPVDAEVDITDVMFQAGGVVSGWVPHVTELPWSSGVAA